MFEVLYVNYRYSTCTVRYPYQRRADDVNVLGMDVLELAKLSMTVNASIIAFVLPPMMAKLPMLNTPTKRQCALCGHTSWSPLMVGFGQWDINCASTSKYCRLSIVSTAFAAAK